MIAPVPTPRVSATERAEIKQNAGALAKRFGPDSGLAATMSTVVELCDDADDRDAALAERDAEIAALKAERDEAKASLTKLVGNMDPCPFSRRDCSLEPEQPCPVCGDLGTFDAENMARDVRCVGSVRRPPAPHPASNAADLVRPETTDAR